MPLVLNVQKHFDLKVCTYKTYALPMNVCKHFDLQGFAVEISKWNHGATCQDTATRSLAVQSEGKNGRQVET